MPRKNKVDSAFYHFSWRIFYCLTQFFIFDAFFYCFNIDHCICVWRIFLFFDAFIFSVIFFHYLTHSSLSDAYFSFRPIFPVWRNYYSLTHFFLFWRIVYAWRIFLIGSIFFPFDPLFPLIIVWRISLWSGLKSRETGLVWKPSTLWSNNLEIISIFLGYQWAPRQSAYRHST